MSVVAISHLLGLTFVARAWCEMLGSPLSTPPRTVCELQNIPSPEDDGAELITHNSSQISLTELRQPPMRCCQKRWGDDIRV